jgi:ABC-type multidrug transport system permease subunit
MPAVIYWATFVIPVTYFIEVLRGIILRGAGLADLWPHVLGLGVCCVAILTLSLARFRKTLS